MRPQEEVCVEVYVDNFNELYKRLLLQPMSFRVSVTDYGARVYLKDINKTNDLLEHITNYVSDNIFKKVMISELSLLGVTDLWIKHKLLNQLDSNVLGDEWKNPINEDMKFYLEESIEKDEPLKLSAYINFRGLSKAEPVRKFAGNIEDVLFQELICSSAKTHINLIGSGNARPILSNFHIRGCPLDATIITEINGQETVLLTSNELNTNILDMSSEVIFNPVTERFKEVQFYIHTLVMMHRWSVNKWVVDDVFYEKLKAMINELGIDVTVKRNQ